MTRGLSSFWYPRRHEPYVIVVFWPSAVSKRGSGSLKVPGATDLLTVGVRVVNRDLPPVQALASPVPDDHRAASLSSPQSAARRSRFVPAQADCQKSVAAYRLAHVWLRKTSNDDQPGSTLAKAPFR